MIVGFADQKLDGLAGGLHRGGQVARLLLKFRGLISSVTKKSSVASLSICRTAESSCSIASVKFTYLDRLESRTGARSYIPLDSVAPSRMSRGNPSLAQSCVTTQAGKMRSG